eukprot:gene36958-31289_t
MPDDEKFSSLMDGQGACHPQFNPADNPSRGGMGGTVM